MNLISAFLSLLVAASDTYGIVHDIIDGKETAPYIMSYAYALDDGAVVSNTQEPQPLMSVFKTHLALAVLQKMQREDTPFTQRLDIPAACWEMDTWSPLRSRYRGQHVSLSLGELLRASVSLSDNITTDILIDYLGGMPALQASMNAVAIPCNLLRNEADMHVKPSSCADNTSSPQSMILLLQGIKNGQFLKGAYQDFLVQCLLACTTGANKIRAAFPTEIPVAHKTGSSGRDSMGVKLADNDAGFVLLPDGRTLYMAIFVTNARISDDECAKEIEKKASEIYQESLVPRQF